MEIERINENTVKFYVSYKDIEHRGFNREEIWYNREKSEQLFWQVMDEVNYNGDEFSIDGPLWIQVQALDKGLEIVVTKAQISKDGQNLELPSEHGNSFDLPMDEKIESLLDEKFGSDDEEEDDDDAIQAIDADLTFIIGFADFEDVIQLSYQTKAAEGINDKLYHYKDRYILLVEFDDVFLDDDQQDNIVSQLLEFGRQTNVTEHMLREYGKVIFEEDALNQIQSYFPQK
ncbi:adaptor protein MecA [Paraliobacillus sediminis]|uniref:adaptor protein MecA n=1 Tax=Paraliobacillus sediminis TaxID=1885916 RepID=UPI000E3D451F|nr:adaptor protein MecA [Paraliobacillus sediminis]